MSSQVLTTFLQESISDLKRRGLYNEVDILEQRNGPEISINGQKKINLASNDYLGFANHPKVIAASLKATQNWGVGAGAVRSINGTLEIHHELERVIADFKGTEAALAFQSGFNCNMGAISAVMGKNDAILSDEANHASIIDGCRLSGAEVIRVAHQDMADLEEKARLAVESGNYQKIMYITDGVFSMDGDVAKIPEIVAICQRFDVMTYVDDAHGTGVMGKGAGTVKHFGKQADIDFQMGTLSKGIGCIGGYVAGSQLLIDWLKSQARPFLFSTAMTPGAAGACIEAIHLLKTQPEYVDRLWANAAYFKKGLHAAGFTLGASETPITPIIVGEEKVAQCLSERLKEEGVYAKAIVYPTVPLGTGRVRNIPNAAHTKDMLDRALAIYQKVGKELGLIL